FGTLVQRLKNLFQPLYVAFGLFQMFFESLAQFLRRSRFSQLGKGFHELRFGVIEIFEFINVKFFQSFVRHFLLLIINFVLAIADLGYSFLCPCLGSVRCRTLPAIYWRPCSNCLVAAVRVTVGFAIRESRLYAACLFRRAMANLCRCWRVHAGKGFCGWREGICRNLLKRSAKVCKWPVIRSSAKCEEGQNPAS